MKRLLAFSVLASALLFSSCKKDVEPATIVDNPTEGTTLVAPYSNTSTGLLMAVDQNGNTIWQRNLPHPAINFQKWEVNGLTRYTYQELDTIAQHAFGTQGILPGRELVLDGNFNVIDSVNLLAYNGRGASDPNSVDAHDFIYLGDHHYITLTYYQKTVQNIPASLNPVANCRVAAPIIQEQQNGQVVWEWDGTNYPELYQQSVEGNNFSADVLHDYVHMNSLWLDATDGNLICSMRNLNQVIKISRTDGHILWRLGGTNSDFPLTADMKFLRQHHATLTDNNQTLLLFDNGEASERAYSRILEFQLNQDSRTVSSFKQFAVPHATFAQYMGSVQKRGDTYFIGCGSVPKMMEVNYNTGKISFEATLPLVSYRALKY